MSLVVPTFTPSGALVAAEQELRAAIERHGELAQVAATARAEVEAARRDYTAAWQTPGDEERLAAEAREREARALASVQDLTPRLEVAARRVAELETSYLALVRRAEQEHEAALEVARAAHWAHVEEAREELRRRSADLLAIPSARPVVDAALPLAGSTHRRPMSAVWAARRGADQALADVALLARWPGKSLDAARQEDEARSRRKVGAL